MGELDCHKCGYTFEVDYERFFDKFAKDENYHTGFASDNIKMIDLEDCTDENGDCDRYEIELTCPKCGAKHYHTDWSK
jgi:uncharacterized protein CbrC (UPF0167 family)